ncbi:MAG: hypothetical protein IJ424_06530 [Oscillospiraceae bacterium]|nr:hypothetical protein [Oscillospiraceae bacterium]
MNMKKVLAVLLAVMMAVSAMAITAFAEDYTIPLYKNLPSNPGYTNTITLTIPVYATYGYFTEGAYFELSNLPNRATFFGGWGDMGDVEWKVNGYKLEKNATTAKVYFGHVAHDFISADYPTVIPVDTTVNGTTTVVLTAEVKSSSQWNWANANADALKKLATSVQFYNADGVAINGSASTIAFWNPAVSGADSTTTSNMTFVNAVTYTDVVTGGHFEYTTTLEPVDKNEDGKIDDNDKVATGEQVAVPVYEYETITEGEEKVEVIVDKDGDGVRGNAGDVVDTAWEDVLDYEYEEVTVETWVGSEKESLNGAKVWSWDHNLNNKAAVLGAETAKLVVKLDKAINGRAIYTLWATNESNALYETNANWWAYDTSRTLVSTVVVDGSVTELVFEVPLDVLYDTAYGVWNGQFAITEEITLKNEVLESDPTNDNYLVDIDDALWGQGTFPDASESGDLTWNRWWGADGFSGAKYKGASIVYAADGQAHVQNNNDVDVAWNAKLSGALATDVYLLLSSSDNTVVEEVEDPVESSTDEEEDVTVDVEEPADEEPAVEENPKTGLALAVVPMLVAAAAVVISKRR